MLFECQVLTRPSSTVLISVSFSALQTLFQDPPLLVTIGDLREISMRTLWDKRATRDISKGKQQRLSVPLHFLLQITGQNDQNQKRPYIIPKKNKQQPSREFLFFQDKKPVLTVVAHVNPGIWGRANVATVDYKFILSVVVDRPPYTHFWYHVRT